MNSNLDRWKYYCKDLVAPDSFIEFGFYFVVSSTLERRVWIGDNHAAIYPNLYIAFTSNPGTGKGEVIQIVRQILQSNRAITVAPNSVTFERLISLLADSTRAIKQEGNPAFYAYASASFVLDELASILRRNQDDTLSFLLQMYDCDNYEAFSLKGKTTIVNGCLNMLVGSQPAKIQVMFNDDLLSEGLLSRMFIIYEEHKRFVRKDPPTFMIEQDEAFLEIQEHLSKLTSISGPVTLSPKADEYFKVWCAEQDANEGNPRSPLNAMKLAMVVHYADKLDNIITLDDIVTATHLTKKIDAGIKSLI